MTVKTEKRIWFCVAAAGLVLSLMAPGPGLLWKMTPLSIREPSRIDLHSSRVPAPSLQKKRGGACVSPFVPFFFDISFLCLAPHVDRLSTPVLLAAATLIGATTINIPHTATVNRTAGCGTTTGSTVSLNTTPSRAALARATTSTSRALLGLHRSSGTGLFFETDTGPSGSKYSAEKILVDPNGVGGAWAGANYSETTFPENLQFVSDLDEIRAGWCIDKSRIYATDLSIGAGFVNTIACAPAGANLATSAAGSSSCFLLHRQRGVTGQMPVRARTHPAACAGDPRRERHRRAVFERAGEGGTEPAIVGWLSRGATRNGCTGGNTTETLFSGEVHHTSWAFAGVGVEWETVLLEGG
ncbi:hypothetical protein B0H14DRAFT_2625978 [Mycena olivaceomarginata]|nr:hypothetical protein B0H14DRAFT_2625978 [Mycena olivaceomarginata]